MFATFLPAPLIGVLTFITMALSLAFWGGLIIPLALLKLLVPITPFRRACSRWAVVLATQWVATNSLIFHALHPMRWQLDFRDALDPRKNYLLICNHQEWTDIVILFDIFHHRTPLLRFFLKHELLFVPFLGTACWAMDFPFMKRHTREQIAANPARRSEDLETTRRACEVYRTEPVTVVNFVEGTRYSEAKRIEKQSPYQRLLRPKSAGLSFTLNAMGEQFAGLIDVTLAYQPTAGKSLLWSWLCGEQGGLSLRANLIPIPAALMHGNYEDDSAYRASFQTWLNELWAKKDIDLGQMRQPLQVQSEHQVHRV